MTMHLYSVSDVPAYQLETVTADENSLLDSLELMFEKEYTQLGIERNGEVIGMVSYRSIARVLKIMRTMDMAEDIAGRPVTIAIEELDPVVSPDEDLVTLFDLLDENPYVLVKQPDQDGFEILTNYDLLHFIRDSSEPFLLIEEIERSVRELFRDTFPDTLETRLESAFAEMEIPVPDTVDDCSFGHYPVFISKNWDDFENSFEEKRDFVLSLLAEVGDIRNKLFHFRTQRSSGVDYEFLSFAHGYFTTRLQ